jgi:outer membrane protein
MRHSLNPCPAACAAIALMLCPAAEATAHSPGELGLAGHVEAGVAHRPDYEGSRSTRTPVYLGFGVEYRTRDIGHFSAGTRGLGWHWASRTASVGLRLGRDPGRLDRDTDDRALRWRPGSVSLRGLGEVPAETTLTLHGHVDTGWLPLHASVSRRMGDVGGLRLTLGTRVDWALGDRLALSLSPGLTWADHADRRAYFGVSQAQASASGKPRFEADAGLHSVQLALTGRYALAPQWSLNGHAVASRLVGDAARSPVTEQRQQLRVGLGLRYDF